MSAVTVLAPWVGWPECPCGCGAQGLKLQVRHDRHLVGCTCRVCIGRRSKRKGAANQSRVLKAAAAAEGKRMDVAPSNEESASLLVHYEVKSGEQTRTASAKTLLDWEKQARLFAERQTPLKKWAVVAAFPDGKQRIWMDFRQFLLLVSELQELP